MANATDSKTRSVCGRLRKRSCGACRYKLRKMFRLSSGRVSASSDGVGNCSDTSLAMNLLQVIFESIFDIPRLVEAALHQRFDSILCSRSSERSDARIPPGAELDVRR